MDDVYHFIDQLNIGIYLCDSKGNTIEANRQFQSMFSYTMEELGVKTIYDLFDQRDADFIKEEIISTSNNRKSSNTTVEVKGKKKRQRSYLS